MTGKYSEYVMCCSSAIVSRRASWNNFSSDHAGLTCFNFKACTLWFLTHSVCIKVNNGCWFTRLSPASKHFRSFFSGAQGLEFSLTGKMEWPWRLILTFSKPTKKMFSHAKCKHLWPTNHLENVADEQLHQVCFHKFANHRERMFDCSCAGEVLNKHF